MPDAHVKKWTKMLPNPFIVEGILQNNFGPFCKFYIKLPKVRSTCPRDENSPNLVTLARIRVWPIFFVA
jgi:hypothetical protein